MLALALLAGVLVGAVATPTAPGAPSFRLSDTCPPSFDTTADGRCRLVTLYQLYSAAPGQGGLRAPLPPARDGFRPEQIDLGRYLFFDPVLSGDGRLSCAHCHHPDHGLSDGRATSMGFGGQGVGPTRSGGTVLRRAAPTLWNVGFLDRLFWDGRATRLEVQAEGPLFSPQEMGNTPAVLARSLNASRDYRRLFSVAFARPEGRAITVPEVTAALAAFEASLVSLNSRYDRYAHGDADALTEQEIRGHNVFRGFVGRCSQCHIPPLFSSSELAVIGAPPVAGQPYDLGAGALRADPALNGAFRVPTLRNIARTAPYFQAGQFATLEDVLAFYNDRRGHAVPASLPLQIHWHVHMRSAELSPADVADLVAFLAALSDESLLPRVPGAVPSGLPVVATAATSREGSP